MVELTLSSAIEVLVQAAHKGQSKGIFSLVEACLLSDTIGFANKMLSDIKADRELLEKRKRSIFDVMSRFRETSAQISRIYHSPGFPGCMGGDGQEGNAEIETDGSHEESSSPRLGMQKDSSWDAIMEMLSQLDLVRQQLDEIYHSPGFPGFLDAQESFAKNVQSM